MYMKLSRSLGMLAVVALTLGGCGERPIGPPPPDAEIPPVAQIPAGIHVIAGLSPSLDYADLAPFAQIVGDATVVGLGESTHTSGGYYQAKARIIR